MNFEYTTVIALGESSRIRHRRIAKTCAERSCRNERGIGRNVDETSFSCTTGKVYSSGFATRWTTGLLSLVVLPFVAVASAMIETPKKVCDERNWLLAVCPFMFLANLFPVCLIKNLATKLNKLLISAMNENGSPIFAEKDAKVFVCTLFTDTNSSSCHHVNLLEKCCVDHIHILSYTRSLSTLISELFRNFFSKQMVCQYAR